jgi:hypothetical protein
MPVILADSGIVTGAFTLGGVVITALAGFWLDWRRQKQENVTRWDKERLAAYSEFLGEAQAVESKAVAQTPGERSLATRFYVLEQLRQLRYRAEMMASANVKSKISRVMLCSEAMDKAAAAENVSDQDRLSGPPRKLMRESCYWVRAG